jgi:hypothetical protein
MLVIGYWILDVGYWILDVGCGSLEVAAAASRYNVGLQFAIFPPSHEKPQMAQIGADLISAAVS